MAKDKKTTLEKADASAKETTKKAKKNDKKSGKKDGGKKQNGFVRFFKGIGKWFRDLKIEFRNVTWPSWHTTSVNTGIVLGTIVVSSILVGLLDSGMLKLMQFLLGLGVSE